MNSEEYGEAMRAFTSLSLIGLVVGIGQLLASRERLTWRIVVGRALSSAGLGASTGIALAWMPGLPLTAQLGLAALIASLGTSGLERLLQKFLGR